jgi:hypothetical protein
MFALRFLAFLAVHCVAESQHSDPLYSCHVVLAPCSVPLQCTVLQRSQHSDPLTAARCLRRCSASFTVHCVAGVSLLILWHSYPCLFCALAAFLAVHCVTEESTLIL